VQVQLIAVKVYIRSMAWPKHTIKLYITTTPAAAGADSPSQSNILTLKNATRTLHMLNTSNTALHNGSSPAAGAGSSRRRQSLHTQYGMAQAHHKATRCHHNLPAASAGSSHLNQPLSWSG
jgi:hypothetical protein